MLPDFRELCKQPHNSNDLRSSEHRSDKASSDPQSSDKFSDERDRAAHQGHSTSCIGFEGDLNHAFFQLWLDQPSWSPIYKTDDGWLTVKSKSGKQVPLTLQAIESAYRLIKTIGKRFGRLTNYLMVDVDIGSRYHPENGSLRPILAALEKLGLTRYILIRSSNSGGLHIYFPLAEPASSWAIACAAQAALTNAGVDVTGGQCELFPNKKAYDAEHNGHRLPLQSRSFILDKDFAPIGNSKTAFAQMWQSAANHQAEKLRTEVDVKPAQLGAPAIAHLPPIAWTGLGQSNSVMRQLVNYGDQYAGKKTVEDLAEWILEVAPKLPGFEQFASKESKNDLRRRGWAYRWAKSHFRKKWQYIAKISPDHNQTVAEQAKQRIVVAIGKLGEGLRLERKKLWLMVCEICRRLFGIAPNYNTFRKHWELVCQLIKATGDLTPSIKPIERTGSFSSELPIPQKSEAVLELGKEAHKLATGRCDPALQDKDLSRLHPLLERAIAPPPEPAKSVTFEQIELKKGQQVIVRLPGCLTNGIKTKVRSRAKDALGRLVYRLNCRAGGEYVILPIECLTVVHAT
ncbi:MAG: hypothetical protein DCF25_16005 [Leptolyngbya foveolarum]|uniref:Uncharacterized protein n=1 Tax=Leptolyngbya foveolarum TaxID=47253 RepID=A0A2W4W2Z5_9CYAN|nr:MAG: hypothetical protein DCF25_16005 [Leptolyngbya foveolarum]